MGGILVVTDCDREPSFPPDASPPLQLTMEVSVCLEGASIPINATTRATYSITTMNHVNSISRLQAEDLESPRKILPIRAVLAMPGKKAGPQGRL